VDGHGENVDVCRGVYGRYGSRNGNEGHRRVALSPHYLLKVDSIFLTCSGEDGLEHTWKPGVEVFPLKPVHDDRSLVL